MRRVERRTGEFLLFALTPPRRSTVAERVQEIADATIQRLRPLDVDGLVLYDIDDESERNPEERSARRPACLRNVAVSTLLDGGCPGRWGSRLNT